MSRANFSPITEALNGLTSAILSIHTQLVEQANAERREFLDLYARMETTYGDLNELTNIVNDAADNLTGIGSVCEDIADKVYNALDEGYPAVPECDYEDFVGFCSRCNHPITHDEPYIVENDEILCEGCGFVADEELNEETDEEIDETPVEA